MKRNIMVVDDSRIVGTQMRKMLEGSDYEVAFFCRSGEEALENYERVQPDLVTMDIVMPGIDGLETCRELRRRWPDAKILMVSSLAYDDTMEAAASLGTQGFLFKPFHREELLEALEKAFADAEA